MRLFLAYIKKLLGIQSPSGILIGYKYEYDMLKAKRRKNNVCNLQEEVKREVKRMELPYDEIEAGYNPLFFLKVGEDGKRVIDINALNQLSEYEPYFVIPKEANPRIVETGTGDYDIVYDKAYPIAIEWRRKKEQRGNK